MPTITAYTQAGDGQEHNEDWYAATDDLVVVLDGATIRTDTGCIHGLPWYVRQLGVAIVAGAVGNNHDLREVLRDAISYVSNLHSATCDLTHPGTPSAAAGVVRIGTDTIDWAVLGDITVMVKDEKGELTSTTDDRVSHTAIDLRHECDRHLIGTPEKMSAILAMKEIELASRNRAGGYWIAAAEPAAADHAYVGSAATPDVRSIGVCSDGAMRALTLTSITGAGGVMELLGSDPKKVVDLVRAAERNDPLGRRIPRNKATDDATAVYVDMNVQPAQGRVIEAERQASIRSVSATTEGLFGALPTRDGRVL
jgi:hypothetical protein